MSYNMAEIETLKACLNEIIDENYFSATHEMKKKLTISQDKQRELTERIDRIEQELEVYKQCHQCHQLKTLEKVNADTQTESQYFPLTKPTINFTPNMTVIHRPRTPISIHGQCNGLQKETKPVLKFEHKVDKQQETNKEPEVICIDSD